MMNPIDLKIDRLDPHDADTIEVCANMMRDSEPWRTLGRGYEGGKYALGQSLPESYVARLTTGEIAGFVVLIMEGAFVGYMQILCVAPNVRRSGVGTALMNCAEQRVFSRHANFFLTVSDFNTEALRFYERLGFTVVGTLNDYLVAGRHEHLMRKSAAPIRGYSPRVQS